MAGDPSQGFAPCRIARVMRGQVFDAIVLAGNEVSDGWVLTCHSLPTSTAVRVAYK